MASLDDLIKKLEANNANRYTPLTADQIKQQATTRYEGMYGQKKLSAQQQFDTNDQALAQQLAGLDEQYAKQLEQSAKNYENAMRTFDRQSLGRGMQRSSYNSATRANINLEGNKAQQSIMDTKAAQAKNIGEQRKLLQNQLGDTLANLDAAQQSDMLAYMDELEAREYDRLRDDTAMQNEIAMNLYQYQFQKEQADQEQARWQAQFDASYGGGDSGGYGGGSYTPNPNNNSGNEDFWNLLNGNSGNTSASSSRSLEDAYRTYVEQQRNKQNTAKNSTGVKKGSKE